ncbi:MAG TPA: hypothetical protein VMM56_14015 [Planctomycetaceae bacterium]|nr:hypothetical protein [Planctomycetaceae bacterium]
MSEEHQISESSVAVAEDVHAGHHTAEPFDDHFDPRDIDAFSEEDTEAGAAIGKMLTIFFFYTVLVMALSTAVTYYWISLE